MTHTDEPELINGIHPILALGQAIPDDDDGVMGSLLTAIVLSQERDADRFQALQDDHVDDLTAQVWAMIDGVNAALSDYEWGGTTASYERVLGRVGSAMSVAGSGPVHDHYRKQITARRAAGECYFHQFTDREPWPYYAVDGDF